MLAEAFPGSPDARIHREKIQSLIDVGIRTFINLMEPSEVDRQGRPFAPYEQVAQVLAAPEAISCKRLAIEDVAIPTCSLMTKVLDHIDHSLADQRPVYVHCWGGVGRTGTVVGCWLLRHELATAENVLQILARLRQQDMQRGHRTSPETAEQRKFVLNWREV